MLFYGKMFTFVRFFSKKQRRVSVNRLVLYLVLTLLLAIGFSDSKQGIPAQGAADDTAVPTAVISNALASSQGSFCGASYGEENYSFEQYATSSDNSLKEDVKFKKNGKELISSQRQGREYFAHLSSSLSGIRVSFDGVLFILALLCRLNI